MKFMAFACLALVGLAACGGTQRSFEEMDKDRERIFEELISKGDTPRARADAVFRGGASYTGVSYGSLSADTRADYEFFNSEVNVDVVLGQGAPVISGSLTNFITEDEEALAGSLSFDGTLVATSNGSGAGNYGLNTDLTGSIESPFDDGLVAIDATIVGLPFGYDAGWLGGRIRDSAGDVRVNGSWVTERD